MSAGGDHINFQRSNDPTIQRSKGNQAKEWDERRTNQLVEALSPYSLERLPLDRWIVGSLGVDFPVSIFPPSLRHFSQPPIKARAFRPRFCSVSAARALVCSDGQAQ
jgi:hypothetical protein